MPRVSVIVPTYNRAHMVTDTIGSILSQTFDDLELIVVDNESVDDTEQVIKAFGDERLRYFRHQNNGVVAVNRNFGISQAGGDFIAFCDDDDLWVSDKLERQLTEFDRDQRVGLVCTNAMDFDDAGEHGRRIAARLRDSDFTFEMLLSAGRIISSSVMVRKAVIDDVGVFDESPEIFRSEDYELWLRIAGRYRVRYLDRALVKYRVHPGAHGQARGFDRGLRIAEEVYQRLIDKGVMTADMYRQAVRKRRRKRQVERLLRYGWAIRGALWVGQLAHLSHALAGWLRKPGGPSAPNH